MFVIYLPLLVIDFGTSLTAVEAKQFCKANGLLYPSDKLDHFSGVFDRIQKVIGGNYTASGSKVQKT